MVPQVATIADALASLRRDATDLLGIANKKGDEIHRDLAHLIISIVDSNAYK
jgi:hypothetical protein